ncbi:MAG: glycosyltransferase [Candidatus Sericytochromatia bacterium]
MPAFQPAPCKILVGPLYHPRVLGDYLQDPLIYPFFLDCQNWKTRPVAYDMVIALSEFQTERQLPYNYQNTTVAELLSHFPAQAQPELLIWWGFYGPIPVDIAESPIPTLLVVSDWHENLTSVLAYAEAFDYVLADQGLVDILNAKGLDHCAYWPSYALYPERSFLISPPLERIWDVAYIGSLNLALHPKREGYLKRLLQLADRYHIRVDTHLYGAEYNQFLNQSRLVFNYSIRGEMNLRAFEAAASGAVVLIEDTNLEVHHYLPTKAGASQACILYNSTNFEQQIIYYLEHEAERQRIAETALQAIQNQSASHQFERLLAFLPKVFATSGGPKTRSFRQKSKLKQALVRIRHLYHLPLARAPEWAVREASELYSSSDFQQSPPSESREFDHLLAACLTDYEFNPIAKVGYQPPLQAERVFAHLLQESDLAPLICFNAAWYCFFRGDLNRALPYSQKALALFSDLDFDPEPLVVLTDCLLPFGHNYFYLHWQRLVAEICRGQAHAHDLRRLICWMLLILQARILSQSPFSAQAESCYQNALALFPEFGTVGFEWARLQAQQGKPFQAIQTYQTHLERHFLQPQAHLALLELMLEQGQLNAAQDWYQRVEPLLRVIPHFESAPFTRLLRLMDYLAQEAAETI